MLEPLQRPELEVITRGNSRALRWFERLSALLSSLVSVPSGGTTGQVLTKVSATDYDMTWQTPSGGGGGVSDGDKGDVVVSGGGTVWTIDAAKTAADRARANHTGTQTASTISDFSEAVDDRVNGLLVAGTNITLTYNDAGNTLTIDAASGGAVGANGSALVDFGAGGVVGSVNVSGQAGLLSGSPIRVWIQGDASADYNAYTHSRILSRSVGLSVENVTAGTGFDIIAASELTLKGVVACRWQWG